VEVRAAKKIAWQLIEILLRQPRLSEDNTASLKDIAAGPLYQALAIPSLENWAHEVMLDALVSALVLDFPNQFAEVIAQELISSGGLALSPLPEPEPELHLGQVLLVSKYFSTLPSRSERQLLVAGSLEKVAKQFLGALTPQPIEANVKHVTTLALGPEPSST
jgi:hypothetical protein